MKIKLVGYRPLDYVSKKTNKRVQGVEIYGVRLDQESDQVIGHSVCTHFISGLTLTPADVNRDFNVVFDVYEFGGRMNARPSDLQEVVSK